LGIGITKDMAFLEASYWVCYYLKPKFETKIEKNNYRGGQYRRPNIAECAEIAEFNLRNEWRHFQDCISQIYSNQLFKLIKYDYSTSCSLSAGSYVFRYIILALFSLCRASVSSGLKLALIMKGRNNTLSS
jgi:hypothetical protein